MALERINTAAALTSHGVGACMAAMMAMMQVRMMMRRMGVICAAATGAAGLEVRRLWFWLNLGGSASVRID